MAQQEVTCGSLVRGKRNRHVNLWNDVDFDSARFKMKIVNHPMGGRLLGKKELALVVGLFPNPTWWDQVAALLWIPSRSKFLWTWASWLFPLEDRTRGS